MSNLSAPITNTNPKILFVDHTAVLGGAELSLLDLVTVYGNGSEVLLFTDGALREVLASRGVKVAIAKASDATLNLRSSGGIQALKNVPELWHLAGKVAQKAQKFDLIYANSQKAFITSALAVLRGSSPLVWYLQDIVTAQHFSKLNRSIAVILANQFASRVIVNSQATGEAFVAAGGNPELVRVVYNGFHSDPFDKISLEAVRHIRTELNINNDTPLIGLFSRLSPWKGQHILLSAVKQLPQVQILLVGDALFGEQAYVSEIKQLANSPELKERVHWLGFRNDIPTLMKACDIIVHTSTEPEPFGRVIVEGQLAQRPVIAAAAGGALELIEPEKTGLLFTPGNYNALKSQIEKLIHNPTLASSLAQQGYINAKTNFSWTTILERFSTVITELV